MAVRRIVVAKHRQRAQDFQARCVHWHEDHRMLLVTRRIRVGKAHEDHHFAAWITGT